MYLHQHSLKVYFTLLCAKRDTIKACATYDKQMVLQTIGPIYSWGFSMVPWHVMKTVGFIALKHCISYNEKCDKFIIRFLVQTRYCSCLRVSCHDEWILLECKCFYWNLFFFYRKTDICFILHFFNLLNSGELNYSSCTHLFLTVMTVLTHISYHHHHSHYHHHSCFIILIIVIIIITHHLPLVHIILMYGYYLLGIVTHVTHVSLY